MDFYESLRLLAIREVVNSRRACPNNDGDPDFDLRQIFRSYSKTFHTPLYIVETLPLQDVLTDYYENMYSDMPEEELQTVMERALLDPEDLKTAQIREDAEDAENWNDMKEIEKEEKLNAAKAAVKKLGEVLEGLPKRMMPTSRMSKEATLFGDRPDTAPKDDGIKMSFVAEDEIDLDNDGFGLTDGPKRPQS